MASLNDIANNYIKKDGSVVLTGSSLQWQPPTIGGTPSKVHFLKAKQNNSNGYGMSLGIGSNGSTCIGAGEAMDQWYSSTDSGDNEDLYLCADQRIYLCSNINGGWAGRKTCTINTDGSFNSAKVYNAVWNDYAEFFERGEETEVGDIIALDENSDEERYIKATSDSNVIVGVHSDTFAHLIGGENPPSGEDFYEYNIKKFIPIGLAGRVKVKVIGPVKKGDYITISPFNDGVGISINNHCEKYGWTVGRTIGQALESKDTEDIGLIKILIMK